MINNFLDEYKKFLKTNGKSNNTIDLYIRDVVLYMEYKEKLNKNISSQNLSTIFHKNEVLAYFYDIKDSSKDKSDGVEINKLYRTLSRKLSGFSKFMDFLVREKKIEKNFLIGFDRTNFIKKNRETISRNYTKWIPEKELFSFVNKLIGFSEPKAESYKVQQDVGIVLTLIFSGLRASELADIKIQNINLNENIIYNVKRKRGIISDIPIEKTYLKPYLHNLIITRKVDSEYLFLNSKKSKIDRHFVYRIVLKYSKIFLGRQIHPHILRHTFATIMCINGANISEVRDMLDHKNIASTELYEHVNKIKNKYDTINKFTSNSVKT